MKLLLFMLVMLNPFAQVLYLSDLFPRLSVKEFAVTHIKATVLAFGIFALFALFGDDLLTRVFQVRMAALQFFGGLIMLFIAFRYIVHGPDANLMFRGDLKDLAPNIALPYMIGPGTIWLSIVIGSEIGGQFSYSLALAGIAGVLLINYLWLLSVRLVFGKLYLIKDTMLGKYFSILMRTNALFIGAIGAEMIFIGLGAAFPGLLGG